MLWQGGMTKVSGTSATERRFRTVRMPYRLAALRFIGLASSAVVARPVASARVRCRWCRCPLFGYRAVRAAALGWCGLYPPRDGAAVDRGAVLESRHGLVRDRAAHVHRAQAGRSDRLVVVVGATSAGGYVRCVVALELVGAADDEVRAYLVFSCWLVDR